MKIKLSALIDLPALVIVVGMVFLFGLFFAANYLLSRPSGLD
jgi:hypothetical protein